MRAIKEEKRETQLNAVWNKTKEGVTSVTLSYENSVNDERYFVIASKFIFRF